MIAWNLPVLMYHDIVSNGFDLSCSGREMSDACLLREDMFSRHVKEIARLDMDTLGFREVGLRRKSSSPVVVTFDDGMLGNYEFAAPVLAELRMRGIFFVSTGLIDSPGYMSWSNLEDLTRCGMEVHSHGISHRPLRSASSSVIRSELEGSKKILEDRLGVGVCGFSWPHGSYSRRGLDIALELGYRVICTSDVKTNAPDAIEGSSCVLGRVDVTSNMGLRDFSLLLEGDRSNWASLRLRWGVKHLVKRCIGERAYRFLYRRYYGVRRVDLVLDS
ncbi:MAG: polysaccharide deacetylase family protein [Deltaproteobacteria bacterium]|nr:polysaccharide deacetylase family protein [Deltaproteobacteria bacterium]